jgi:uncharacterized protein (DUF3084 family)
MEISNFTSKLKTDELKETNLDNKDMRSAQKHHSINNIQKRESLSKIIESNTSFLEKEKDQESNDEKAKEI